MLSETVGAKLLVEDGAVVGVRTGDKGRDKQGGEKSELRAGLRRHRPRDRARRGLLGPPHRRGAQGARPGGASDPQVWALGVKEVWEVEQPLDRVIHTLGWPLRSARSTRSSAARGSIRMNREGEPPRVSIGFVVGLDYADARLSVHDVLQEFKLHPLVRKILDGGKRVGLGRQGDPGGRLLGDAAAARAGHGHLRRRRRHGQRAAAQGHPLRDPLRHARGRDDLRAAQGRLDRLLRLRGRGPRLRDRQGPVRVAQHEAAVRQGLLRRRRDHQRDGGDQGPAARAATGRRTATPTSR